MTSDDWHITVDLSLHRERDELRAFTRLLHDHRVQGAARQPRRDLAAAWLRATSGCPRPRDAARCSASATVSCTRASISIEWLEPALEPPPDGPIELRVPRIIALRTDERAGRVRRSLGARHRVRVAARIVDRAPAS